MPAGANKDDDGGYVRDNYAKDGLQVPPGNQDKLTLIRGRNILGQSPSGGGSGQLGGRWGNALLFALKHTNRSVSYHP